MKCSAIATIAKDKLCVLEHMKTVRLFGQKLSLRGNTIILQAMKYIFEFVGGIRAAA